MILFYELVLTIAGLALLWGGAEIMVGNASRFAAKIGISPLIVGLTVIAVGTSTPELVVSTVAALQGDIGISIGNIVGSNIANIGLILGIAAFLMPIAVKNRWIRREIPIMLLISAEFVYFSYSDSNVGFYEGMLLLLTLGLFMLYIARFTLNEMSEFKEIARDSKELENRSFPWRLRHYAVLAFLGLIALIGGSKLAVNSGANLAEMLGVSHAVIGLTLIAFGTSLPELATTVVSALRKEADLALGNIIGSNIFNLTLIGGTTALITPLSIETDPKLGQIELPLMAGISLLLYLFARHDHSIGKWKGACLVIIYAVFILITVGTER